MMERIMKKETIGCFSKHHEANSFSPEIMLNRQACQLLNWN
jgi:hypothetical protein